MFRGRPPQSLQATRTPSSLPAKRSSRMAGGTALTDITIQANANYVAGSDEETGTATLVARGNAQSLITLNLSGGQRQEIRNGIAGSKGGRRWRGHRHGHAQLLY